MIVKFIEENKWIIVIVLLAFFMAYFMGFTISTIVDYRLRDALINIKLPRPKVIIGDSKIEGFSNSKKIIPEIVNNNKDKLPKNNTLDNETNNTTKLNEKPKGCKTTDETLKYANNYKNINVLYNMQSPYLAANAEDLEDEFMEFEN